MTDACSLKQFRTEIDSIDRSLIEFLAKRFELSLEIAMVKQKTDAPVFQPNRALEVKQHYLAMARSLGLDSEFALNLYKLIHDESCRVQVRSKTRFTNVDRDRTTTGQPELI
ncbi:chorismate mutase [Alicyclobacillus dauci]|uniref:Chorismate mutase n=1 Tax=Alicyclobacillus dauci TaxID=1475485 RepID=A0ABY6YXY1_9BACL|nr:chorismate mutase [Alicyclobacillus dauci]WAH35274.1 chorismate mutase [Alicyclobacillus dauci]